MIAKKKSLDPFTNPFLIAEWVYRVGKGEIHSLKDATMLNDLSELRKSYLVITTAGMMAQDLLKTQWPEKPGSGPYALTVAFLQKLELNPETLLASFRLKLLLHDGFLGLEMSCSQCGKGATSLGKEGSYCREHGEGTISFSPQEWELLHQLTFGRQFQLIQQLRVEKSTQEKIGQLFVL